MKRSRFTEEQIIAVLREHEAGVKTVDPARKHGNSEATLYNWKTRYGGMDVSATAAAHIGRASARVRPVWLPVLAPLLRRAQTRCLVCRLERGQSTTRQMKGLEGKLLAVAK